MKETTGLAKSQTGEQTALLLQPNPPTAGMWDQWDFSIAQNTGNEWYI